MGDQQNETLCDVYVAGMPKPIRISHEQALELQADLLTVRPEDGITFRYLRSQDGQDYAVNGQHISESKQFENLTSRLWRSDRRPYAFGPLR